MESDPDQEAAFARLLAAKRAGDDAYLQGSLLDDRLRGFAARFLADRGCTTSISEIARLLDASDALTRSAAIRALTRLRATEYLDRFWDSAHLETSSQERLWAIGALQLGGARERDYLVSLLDNADFDVRRAAVFALGNLGDPTALDAVTRALRRQRRRHPFRYYTLDRTAYVDARKRIARVQAGEVHGLHGS
jgi:HEAT repeat protein